MTKEKTKARKNTEAIIAVIVILITAFIIAQIVSSDQNELNDIKNTPNEAIRVIPSR